jgi:hypothetical protein
MARPAHQGKEEEGSALCASAAAAAASFSVQTVTEST